MSEAGAGLFWTGRATRSWSRPSSSIRCEADGTYGDGQSTVPDRKQHAQHAKEQEQEQEKEQEQVAEVMMMHTKPGAPVSFRCIEPLTHVSAPMFCVLALLSVCQQLPLIH